MLHFVKNFWLTVLLSKDNSDSNLENLNNEISESLSSSAASETVDDLFWKFWLIIVLSKDNSDPSPPSPDWGLENLNSEISESLSSSAISMIWSSSSAIFLRLEIGSRGSSFGRLLAILFSSPNIVG